MEGRHHNKKISYFRKSVSLGKTEKIREDTLIKVISREINELGKPFKVKGQKSRNL